MHCLSRSTKFCLWHDPQAVRSVHPVLAPKETEFSGSVLWGENTTPWPAFVVCWMCDAKAFESF